MKKFAKALFIFVALGGGIIFSATSYAEKFANHTLPAVTENNGRLFIYRTKSVFGAAMRPEMVWVG